MGTQEIPVVYGAWLGKRLELGEPFGGNEKFQQPTACIVSNNDSRVAHIRDTVIIAEIIVPIRPFSSRH